MKKFFQATAVMILFLGLTITSPSISRCEEEIALSPIEKLDQEPYVGTIDYISPKEIVIDDFSYGFAPGLIVLKEDDTPISLRALKIGDRVSFTITEKDSITSIKRIGHRQETAGNKDVKEKDASIGTENRPKSSAPQNLRQEGKAWRNY